MQPEFKRYDNAVSIAASSAWQMPTGASDGAPVVGLAQGTDDGQRVGRQICVKTVEFNLTLTTTVADEFRWMLVLDRQANGAIAGAADLMASTAPDGFLNTDNDERFDVLLSGSETLRPHYAAQSIVEGAEVCWQGDMLMQMHSTTGALTEFTENQLLLVTCSVGGHVSAAGFSRITFADDQYDD